MEKATLKPGDECVLLVMDASRKQKAIVGTVLEGGRGTTGGLLRCIIGDVEGWFDPAFLSEVK